ncbi:MAG: PIN domain-containing protein [Candidatus Limnocylindrales bacterium]
MSVVIDADVLIGVLRDLPGAHHAVAEARLRDPRLLSVTPVRVEVLRGMRPGEEQVTTALLEQFDWITVDVALADRAGELGRKYRQSHRGIEIVDLLLAAAAERYGARLLTRNVRHFPMVPGLQSAY